MVFAPVSFFFLLLSGCTQQRPTPKGSGEIKILQDTWLKSKPTQAGELPVEKKCKLFKNEKFAVKEMRADESTNHFFLQLSGLSDCKFSSGYLYAQHVSFSGKIKKVSGSKASSLGTQSEIQKTPGEDSLKKTLKMPQYYYQWHNQKAPPGSSCGITSASMLMSYLLQKKITADDVFSKYGTHTVGQSPEGLASIYTDYGLTGHSDRFGSFEKIKNHIDQKEPVVVHGYFTAGHIVLIVGYNEKGFVVYDPAGDWVSRSVYGGYPNAPNDSQAGKGVVYEYSAMEAAIVEPSDNSLWMSWADNPG